MEFINETYYQARSGPRHKMLRYMRIEKAWVRQPQSRNPKRKCLCILELQNGLSNIVMILLRFIIIVVVVILIILIIFTVVVLVVIIILIPLLRLNGQSGATS